MRFARSIWQTVWGKKKAIPINDFIDLAIFGEAEGASKTGKPILMKRVKVNARENTFVFNVKDKPVKAGIDPYNYLIDRIPDDNLKGLSEN
jgi:ABC-2 type transport system permease protein